MFKHDILIFISYTKYEIPKVANEINILHCFCLIKYKISVQVNILPSYLSIYFFLTHTIFLLLLNLIR